MSTAIVERKQAAEPILFTVTEETIRPLAAKYLGLKINGVNDKEGLAIVKEARSKVRTARTTIEKERVAAKAFYLEEGKKVDTAAKSLSSLIEPVEKHLVDQLTAVEEEQKRIEDAKLVARLTSRMSILQTVGGIPAQIATTINSETVKVMTDDRFNDFAIEMKELNVRLAAEAKAKQEEEERNRIEAEKLAAERAEFDRLKAEEAERQRVENEKRAAELAAEKAKLDAVRAEQAKEAARIEAANRVLVEERLKRELAEQAERLAKEKVAAADAARIEQERKNAEAEQRRQSLMPVAEKIQAYAEALLAVTPPELSDPLKGMQAKISQYVVQCCGQIMKEAEQLRK